MIDVLLPEDEIDISVAVAALRSTHAVVFSAASVPMSEIATEMSRAKMRAGFIESKYSSKLSNYYDYFARDVIIDSARVHEISPAT